MKPKITLAKRTRIKMFLVGFGGGRIKKESKIESRNRYNRAGNKGKW